MVLGGAVFAATQSFVLLLLAATVGVISPSGNEVGPFLAIEQAALAQTVAAGQRTRVFAWYQLAGSFATAAGSLACGVLVQLLQSHAVGPLQSYRVDLCGYAAAGLYPQRARSGRVSWRWMVGTRTTPGRWPIDVACGAAGSLHTSFLVT